MASAFSRSFFASCVSERARKRSLVSPRSSRSLGPSQCSGSSKAAARRAHLHDHAVAACTQQALVEAQVVRDVVAALLDRMPHAFVRVLDLADVPCGCPLRRKAYGGGLEHTPQVLQVAQEFAREPR